MVHQKEALVALTRQMMDVVQNDPGLASAKNKYRIAATMAVQAGAERDGVRLTPDQLEATVQNTEFETRMADHATNLRLQTRLDEKDINRKAFQAAREDFAEAYRPDTRARDGADQQHEVEMTAGPER